MEQIVWSTAIASAAGGSIGLVMAFFIISWLNALMEKNDRIVKLEAGQAKLEVSQAKLEAGQVDLRRSLGNVEAGLTEIRGLLNQPRPATGDNP